MHRQYSKPRVSPHHTPTCSQRFPQRVHGKCRQLRLLVPHCPQQQLTTASQQPLQWLLALLLLLGLLLLLKQRVGQLPVEGGCFPQVAEVKVVTAAGGREVGQVSLGSAGV